MHTWRSPGSTSSSCSGPSSGIDAWLTGLLDGAPLLVALGIALALGLRHASDPDHLVAVTSLVAADDRGTRDATRLGVWWGHGARDHAWW